MTSTAHAGFFFRRFLEKPRQVAAVCPSSKHLAAVMLRGIETSGGGLFVEYGPGTGAFTQHIEAAMRRGARTDYLGIELDPDFHRILQSRFPDLRFELGRVEDQRIHLAAHDLGSPRWILSGLPLISMASMDEIVRTARELLCPGGLFRTFSYVHSYLTPGARRLRALMRETFPVFEMSKPIARNVPPALVLTGRVAGE